MSDFILETRPTRSRLPPVECPSGFVAELRPSSRRRVILESPQKGMHISDNTELKSLNYPNHNPNDNLEMDVNELLQNKLFSKEKISNILHSSVVQLINTFLKGYCVTEIRGLINISLAESPQMISVNLSEDYRPFKMSDGFSESLHNLKFKDVNMSRIPTQAPPLEEMRSFEGDLQKIVEHTPVKENNNRDSAESLLTETMKEPSSYLPVAGSEFMNENMMVFKNSSRRMSEGSDKSDNDEESGYSSSERESVGSPPRKASIESIEHLENSIIEDAELEEPKLVIDVAIKSYDKVQGSSTTLEVANAVEYDEYIDFDQKNRWNEHTTYDMSSTENHVVKAEIRASQNRDIRSELVKDIPMDLSGDCQVNVEAQTTKEGVIKASGLTETELLSCKKCPGTLLRSIAYEKHMLEIHNIHACSTCNKDFSSKNNLKRHVRIHTGSRPYKCGQCDMSFARKDDLKGHTLKHDFNKPFRCSVCKKGYIDRACVKNHMSKEHCSRLMKICPQCGESFDREEAFLEHKQTHPSLKQFACETCPFIGTNHLMAMKHILLHSHKLFSCKPCNAYFADPFDYTKHVRKHKKNKDYSCYVCCFCNCTLPTYEQFVRHEYSHAQGKLHECSVCKKQFKSKASMLEHAQVHSNSSTLSDPDTNMEVEKTITAISTDTPRNCVEEKTSDSLPSTLNVIGQTSEISRTFEEQVCHSTTEIRSSESAPVQNTTVINDNFEGQLLDLSMKPSKSNNENSAKEQGTVIDQTEQKQQVDGSSSITTSSMSNSKPRNGFVIDTRVVELDTPSHDACLVNGQASSCSKDEEFQIVWQSPSYHIVEDTMKQVSELENLQNINTVKQASFLSRQKSPKLHVDGQNTVSSDHSNRYKPYSKMVDLASKFIAARGDLINQNLLKDIGNTQSELLQKHNPAPLMTQNRGVSLTRTLLQMGAKGNVSSSDLTEKIKQEYTSIKETILPASRQTIIGLSGKPCLAPTGNTSPVLKQETADKHLHHLHQQCSIQTSTPSVVFKNLNSGNTMQQQNIDRPLDVLNTNKDTTTINSNSDTRCSSSGSTHECDICNMNFESFNQLESHSVINHNRYLCEFCLKSFTARPNRDRHVRYHTGERPYKCELCPSAFFRGDDLKYHRTTRHPMEQISCNRCAASFTWQKDLERHLRHSKCVTTA